MIDSISSTFLNTNYIQVIIAGGGPSGAATALSLRRRGISCLVAEAAAAPRFKAGETIPPNALPLLRRLGIESLLEASQHLHSYGNRFAWGDANPIEKNFLAGRQQHGWHIDRMFFEQQLQTVAVAAGAQWCNGTRLSDCSKTADGWRVSLLDAGGERQEMDCSFIVDATGRASRIARNMGVQRQRMDNLSGVTVCIDTTGTNCPLYTFVEAMPGGWWYAAPLTDSRLITTFMTDADLLDPAMLSIEGYMSALRNTEMIRGILDATSVASCTAPVTLTASTSYLTDRCGDGWLAVGDAAFAYDPLSSYGITSALESGYYAGHAIADTLSGMDEALTGYDWLMCQAFSTYMEMYNHQYQVEKRWPEEEFWKRRSEQK